MSKKQKNVLPPFASKTLKSFGMIFPQPTQIPRPGAEQPEKLEWFPVDAQLLALTRKVSGAVHLASCTSDKTCLPHQPKVIVGGTACPDRRSWTTEHSANTSAALLRRMWLIWKALQ